MHDAILAHEAGRIPADLRYVAGEWRAVAFPGPRPGGDDDPSRGADRRRNAGAVDILMHMPDALMREDHDQDR